MSYLTFSSFGELLKAFRRRRRLTQKALAAKIGVHVNTISIWERGNYLPESKTMVLEVASQLDLSQQETRQLLEASLTALSSHWLLPFPRNPFFTGRAEILEKIDALLHTSSPVALSQSYALHGLGGIGKTQLAVEYAYQHALRYTAIFWIGAESAGDIIASFLTIADVLQLPEREEADQQRVISAVQRWLTAHQGWLLIWDNLEDFELLQRFLPATPYGATLITTRSQPVGTLAQGIQLETMPLEEGMVLLLRRAKLLAPQAGSEQVEQFAGRSSADYAAAQALVTSMGGLPLALDQAGAYIEESGCSIDDYLRRYTDQRTLLLDRRGWLTGGHPESVTATFRLICQRLEQDYPIAAHVLRVCALLHAEAIPEEIFVEGAFHLGPVLEPLAAEPLQFDATVTTLRTFSLVQRYPETHTLSIHRLVQVVLQEEMSASEHTQWCRRAIHALNALFPEALPEAWQQCERLLPHVLSCAALISDQEGEQSLAELLRKAADYLRERAQHEQAHILYQRAWSIWKHVIASEHLELGFLLSGLAKLSYRQGKYEQAERQFQQARHVLERLLGTEHSQVALAINNLAVLYAEQGKYEQAEEQFHQARQILERLLGPEHPQVAISLSNLAILSDLQGKYEQAEGLYQQTITIREQHLGPDHPETARSLMGLANLYSDQGKYEQAQALYQRARSIWEQVMGPEHPEVATVLNNLADLYAELGDYQQAEPLYQQARSIWEKTLGPEHPQVASLLNGQANLYREQGRYQEAEAVYRRSLTIREQRLGPDHPETARSLAGLGLLYGKQKNHQQAELLLRRACAIFEQSLGQAHPETVKTQKDYQSLLAQRKRTPEAYEEQPAHAPQNNARQSTLSEEGEDSTVQEVGAPPCLKKHNDPAIPDRHVVVRGRSEQIAYTRNVRGREVTLTCVVCGKTVTQLRYPGGKIKYCSDICRDTRKAQMHEERVRKQREKRRTERLALKKTRHGGV